MYVISSKGIPANVTGRDDVATRKYKSTCGEGSGSFCCSVNALCVYVLFTVVCPLYIMATGKQVSDKQRFRLCASHCPRFITGGDTHSLCIACLGAEHAQSALEEADCPHCVRISMRSLRFRRALFEESALTSAPRCPTLAEAERRLKSWGSQVDLTEKLEMGMSFSPSSPARSSAQSVGSEACSGTVSSAPRESTALMSSSSEEEGSTSIIVQFLACCT